MIIIPYLIRDVIANVNTSVIEQLQSADPDIIGINYQFGPFLEVCTTIMEMTKVDSESEKKYPLVCLVFPFIENNDGKADGIDISVPIRLIIATWSNCTDKTADRYIKNFIPILYPIYGGILDELDNNRMFEFTSADTISHTKTDWPFYGGETAADIQKANMFGDFVDAIELKINLKILTPNCQ